MASIPLKPEYGPTLGRLLAPRWHDTSRLGRILATGACVALLALLVGAGLSLENAHYSHGGPAPFSFSYRDLYRTAPGPGEYVRVDRRVVGRLQESFAVGSLQLAPYSGALGAELPLYATHYIDGLRRRYVDFVLRGEGKTRVNTVPAYHILYTARVQGVRMYGRDILLLPERSHPRMGVVISMLALPGAEAAVNSPLKVGTTGALELPVETFTIG
jgi:hypothetical protein